MTEGRRLTGSMVREPLRAKLAERTRSMAPHGAGMESAVLLSLFERDGEMHTWLVRRARGMRRHSGQVAFPGGKRDPSDRSPIGTALREAREEIGLLPSAVDVLGPLDELVIGTGFTVSPFVGWLLEPFSPVPNPAEVARVFAAPLRVFLDPPSGIPPFRGYRVDGELVWGATAAMARSLGLIVAEVVGP
jgi:8-oxo-dGTP pyrophosphatase MutT (NUDIX family)